MSEGRVRANGVEIAYDTFGEQGDPPLLLVMGLGMQLIHWHPELCGLFARRAFHVIRFDNRDAGLSTKTAAPAPKLTRAFLGGRVNASYRLEDMADDAFGLLDGLEVDRAHVVGISMGGMIAQTMAIRRPERVLSLASIMSTTGERRAGRPKLRVMGVLMRRAPRDRAAYIEYFVRMFRRIGSPGFPTDDEQVRALAAAGYDRCYHPAGVAHQLAAILASTDRTEQLRQLRVPSVVIHGTNDPLVPFRGGRATARAIPDSRLVAIPGMGHDLPRQVWPQVVDAVVENTAQAAKQQVA
jgi:pimeloyl-ACP methyl ester carboxylesterase